MQGSRFSRHAARYSIYTLLIVAPLLFGAVHPLIQGCVIALIFFGPASWYLAGKIRPMDWSPKAVPVPLVLLLSWIALSVIPLPCAVVDFVSPVRADSLRMVRDLVSPDVTVTTLSYSRATSQFAGYFLLALVLYYFSLHALLVLKGSLCQTLLVIFTCVGLFEACYGLAQAAMPELGVLWLPGQKIEGGGWAQGTIIYKNQYAALLNLCWPMAVALGLRYSAEDNEKKIYKTPLRRKKAKAGWFKVFRGILPDFSRRIFSRAVLPFWSAILMILAVLLSRSRGGILAMLGITFLLLLLLPFSLRRKMLVATAALGTLLLYGSLFGLDVISERFAQLLAQGDIRWRLWRSSFAILRDHLFSGTGLDTYRFLTPVYLEGMADHVLWDRAHNEYLEAAIELGLPVAIMLLCWCLWSGVRYWKTVSIASSFQFAPDIFTAIAALAALCGFLMHGLVDFAWRLPVNALYAVSLLAITNSIITRQRVPARYHDAA